MGKPRLRCLCALGATLIAGTVTRADSASSIGGAIRDGRGAPAAGAVIFCEQKGWIVAQMKVGSNGRFLLRDLPPAPARLSVRFPGEPPAWCCRARQLTEAEVKKGVTIDFKGEEGVLLTARFVGEQDGKPVTEDLTVQCDGAAGLQKTSLGRDGAIRYRTPPGHVIVLPTTPEDYARQRGGGRSGRRVACQDVMLTSDRTVDVRADVPRRFAAKVQVMSQEGKPVAGATVSIEAEGRFATARTDTTGIGRLDGATRYTRAYAQAPDGSQAMYDSIETAPDSGPAVIHLEPTVRCEVRVVDERLEPIDGVRIALYWSNLFVQETTTGATGVVSVPLLPGWGEYQVAYRTLDGLHGMMDCGRFTFDPRTRLVSKDEPPPVTTVMLGRHTMTGDVVDENGAPVSDGSVNVLDPRDWPSEMWRTRPGVFSAPIGLDGRFVLRGLPAGWVTIAAVKRLPSFTTWSGVEERVASDATGVRLVLRAPQPYDIRKRVTGPEGEPLAGAEVAVYAMEAVRRERDAGGDWERLARENQPIVTAQTAADGAVTVGPMQPGAHYEVVVTKPGWSVASYHVHGPRRPVNIVLQPSVSVTGRVRTERGEPVPGAEVVLRYIGCENRASIFRYIESQPPGTVSTTDGDGRFALGGIPREYKSISLKIRARGFYETEVPFENLEDLVLERDTAPRAVLTGRVTDERTGQPAADVTVRCESRLGRHANTSRRTVTGHDGRYQIGDLPTPQQYRVWLEQPKAEPGVAPPWTHRLRHEVVIQNMKGADGIDFTLIDGASVSGRAFDEDGRPMPNVSLSVSSWEHGRPEFGATTGADGRWAARLPPGTWWLSAECLSDDKRWREDRRKILLEAGEKITDADFHLIPSEPPER